MLVKLDEDLPLAAAAILDAAGHERSHRPRPGDGRLEGSAIWKAVQSEGRFLVTADKGFADVRTHPPGAHAGILLLRPDADGIGAVIELLETTLATCALESLSGSVAVATLRGLRVRRSPATATMDPEA